MTDAIEDHNGTVSTGDRTITSLHFADDKVGEKAELAKLFECLDKAATAW